MKKLFLIALIPFFALSQAVQDPKTAEDLWKLWPFLIDAFKQSKWLAVGACSTLVLVYLFRQFVLPKLNLTAKSLPLISALVGLVVGPAIAIVGGAPLGAALLAITSGPVASTLWDAVLKYFAPAAPDQK